MKLSQMKSIIEGLLFVSGDEGLDVKQMVEVLEQDQSTVWDAVRELQSDFNQKGRGIQIVEMAGTFQLTSLPEHAPYFERLAHTPSHSTLSQAALETLSIVAYKQPITRIEVEDIRGVKSDRALHTLVAKQLIQEIGRAEAIGRPILYGTTGRFLDYLGLNSLEDLPASDSFAIDEKSLEEETRLLFKKLDAKQLTMEELDQKEQ